MTAPNPASLRMKAAKDWSIGKARREELLYEASKRDGHRLTVNQVVILHNALGLAHGQTPYRKYFCAPSTGADRAACELLALNGFMTKDGKAQPSGNHFFFVTQAGAALLGHNLPQD